MTRRARTVRADRRGFTLIEILVVVAIVAMLISILLPSLSLAREHGRRAVCLSNLHQSGIGFSLYSADFKQYLPAREVFAYFIKQVVDATPPATGRVRVPINYGALYGKYVGKDLHIFFCPGNMEYGYDDPQYGAASFFNTSNITWGGYIYAVPLLPDPPTYPRDTGKGVYPKEAGVVKTKPGLSPLYAAWADKKVTSSGYDPRKRILQALEADDVIATAKAGSIGLGEFVHKTGYNVLFSDYHAKWVHDYKRIIAHINGGTGPTSGQGGLGNDKLFDAWEILSSKP
jgi:prepilin-type N-terminal cleavage/methylation domain-containing protein